MNIVIFTEEPSMVPVAEHIARLTIGDRADSLIILPHQGKSDLESSFPRKVRNWNVPDTKFIVLRDNDGGDCIALKQRLIDLCPPEKLERLFVRIVCQELEAWFIGDLEAVDLAYGTDNAKRKEKVKFREPDTILDPKELLKELVSYQPLNGSRMIAPHLVPDRNRSVSFHAFVSGLEKVVGD